jgi:hypothetical protein
MPEDNAPSRSEQFAYDFDIWYTSDPMSEVYLLAAVNAVFCFMLFVLFWVTGSLTDLSGFEWFSEMFWMSWGQLSGKAPKARDPDGFMWPTRGVRVFAAFAGMFAFSLIVGFIKSALKARLKALKLGKGRVFEENFSMIIGWNDRILPLVDQLTLANESSGGGVIVVLAPKSKPDMDSFFVDNIEDWRATKIVTRKGDTINPNDLLKATCHKARSIVILSQGDDADEADAQACRCTLALTGGMPAGVNLSGHVVVELRDIDNAPVVRMGVPDNWTEQQKRRTVIPLIGNDMTGRLMVQCSIEAGLARCFTHILAFDGNEFYFSDGKEWMDQLYGKRFADACFMFADAVCIGIKLAVPEHDTGSYILLNPPGTHIIEEGDSLLFIAEDDDTYQPGELKLTNCGAPPDFEEAAKPATKTMLIGWRRDIQDMVFELDKWVEAGSILIMLSDQPSIEDRIQELADADLVVDGETSDLERLTVEFQQQNPIFRRELQRVDIPSFDSILVLTETRPGTEGLCSDSRSMITMLLTRDLQNEATRDYNASTYGRRIPSNEATVISEILDPRTAELIKLAKTDDHIVSNELISMALGQMSEQADLGPLIDDLFSEAGNEMHIKDVRLFAYEGETLSFWEIMNRARQRCEVAIGYQLRSDFEANAPDKGLILNPPDKSQRITWQTRDKIVVISED